MQESGSFSQFQSTDIVLNQPESSGTRTFQPRLIVIDGKAPGETFLVEKDQVILGRTKDSDITIRDHKLSRHHARIVQEGIRYVIEDLQSTNGTQVNGKRVNRQKLCAGDRIVLGKTEIIWATTQDDARMAFDMIDDPDRSYSDPAVSDAKRFGGFIGQIGGSAAGGSKRILVLGMIAATLGLLMFTGSDEETTVRKSAIYEAASVYDEIRQSNLNPIEKQRLENVFRNAEQSFVNGNYAMAAKKATIILEMLPNSRFAARLPDQSLEADYALNRHRDSIEEDEFIMERAGEIDKNLALAKKALRLNQFDQAILYFQEVLTLDPKNIEALAGHRVAENRLANAGPVQKRRPSNTSKTKVARAKSLLLKAKTAMDENEFTEAMKSLSILLAMSPAGIELIQKAGRNEMNVANRVMNEKLAPQLIEADRLISNNDLLGAKKVLQGILSAHAGNTEAQEKIVRVREAIRSRAKSLYAQAVVMESIPEIDEAKQKWRIILKLLDPTDPYAIKARRKLAKY
jgi:tetratricopeptide (TPR) repeat protein